MPNLGHLDAEDELHGSLMMTCWIGGLRPMEKKLGELTRRLLLHMLARVVECL
jgi:hypothetical protein